MHCWKCRRFQSHWSGQIQCPFGAEESQIKDLWFWAPISCWNLIILSTSPRSQHCINYSHMSYMNYDLKVWMPPFSGSSVMASVRWPRHRARRSRPECRSCFYTLIFSNKPDKFHPLAGLHFLDTDFWKLVLCFRMPQKRPHGGGGQVPSTPLIDIESSFLNCSSKHLPGKMRSLLENMKFKTYFIRLLLWCLLHDGILVYTT